MNIQDLPKPSEAAQAHSAQLARLLKEQLAQGPMSFSTYMQQCLYAPGLGYYAAGSQKFGEAGDFTTAPLISSLFSTTLAMSFKDTLLATQGAVLELGAGNGVMARDSLIALDALGLSKTPYYILEVSPDCRAQQAETLKDYADRVQWLDTLPKDFKGVIVANEVLDALPVQVFAYEDHELYERKVAWGEHGFEWRNEPADDPAFITAVETLPLTQEDKQHYVSEVNVNLPVFVRSLLNVLKQGQLVFIDYGFLQEQYYMSARNMGTLMCHYRHHAHSDPFLYPGLQDITAHVDFSVVGNTALNAGYEAELYTQAEYLLSNGLFEAMEAALNATPEVEKTKQTLTLSKQVQKLIEPHEMGELFKVMVITVAEN